VKKMKFVNEKIENDSKKENEKIINENEKIKN
jgi:hypothetical protein